MNKSIKEMKLAKLDKEIAVMKNKELTNCLKVNGLPVFGTLPQK
jgi:hypothetical protein